MSARAFWKKLNSVSRKKKPKLKHSGLPEMFTVIDRNHGVRVYPTILDVCRAYADPNLRIAPHGHGGLAIKIASEHALSKALREQRKVKLVAEGDEQLRYTIERHG